MNPTHKLTALLALTCPPLNALAADAYPARPIRMVVPFAAGGGSDIIARLAAPRLTTALGQQVVVDNRPGGNTVIGVGLVGSARPDGYTLLLANANFTINAALFEKLPYDPIRDFTAIAPLSNVANVLVVHPGLPVHSVKELIALAKTRPGALNFASPGAGTSSHMAGVLLKALAGIDFTIITYKGAGPAVIDLVGGQVSMAVAAMSSVTAHIKSGRLRALGVTTATRSPTMPELPTIAESGVPGYDVTNWFGVLAASGTPQPIAGKLSEAIGHMTQDPGYQKAMTAQGNEPFPLPPAEFGRFIQAEVAKWAKIGRDYKLRVE